MAALSYGGPSPKKRRGRRSVLKSRENSHVCMSAVKCRPTPLKELYFAVSMGQHTTPDSTRLNSTTPGLDIVTRDSVFSLLQCLENVSSKVRLKFPDVHANNGIRLSTGREGRGPSRIDSRLHLGFKIFSTCQVRSTGAVKFEQTAVLYRFCCTALIEMQLV